jgi:uncharacterized protein YbjT (DUF2867 family)
MRILVTGATGYIGGRLIPRLLEGGHTVRALVRDPNRIAGWPWADRVEVASGDLLIPGSLSGAFEGIDVAYYLVHAMTAGGDFAQKDRQAATTFADAAAAAGVKHVVYLGGLQPKEPARSAHLKSRAEVGEILRARCPTTEFRAGPIIGAGSASFEMVRYLTERLPVMVAPKWILNPVHPIASRDVLRYLQAAAEREPMGIVPIGAEETTFKGMMLTYASVRGLHRVIFRVPVLAPGLAARWIGGVTPIPNRLAVPLVRGVIQPLRIEGDKARQLFPEIEPMSYRAAVERALDRVEAGEIETRWSGSLGESEARSLEDREGLIREVRTVAVEASPATVYDVFARLGGERGWLVWNWAWTLRGFLDKLLGGPGLRRGRRDARDLYVGEAVDWWRVETVEEGRLLRLRAEMKLPGEAWLQWEADSREAGAGTRLVQTALFAPRGLGGVFYWYGLYPFHRLIFTALVHAIAREAERVERSQRAEAH